MRTSRPARGVSLTYLTSGWTSASCCLNRRPVIVGPWKVLNNSSCSLRDLKRAAATPDSLSLAVASSRKSSAADAPFGAFRLFRTRRCGSSTGHSMSSKPRLDCGLAGKPESIRNYSALPCYQHLADAAVPEKEAVFNHSAEPKTKKGFQPCFSATERVPVSP